MRPDTVGLGGFDSHAFPPRTRTIAAALLLTLLVAPVAIRAQDTVTRAPAPRVSIKPPISPGHAFIASALLPGLGQSALGRGTGALFIAAEAIGLAMYSKSRHDLAIARAYTADSTPLAYSIDAATGLPARNPETGALIVSQWSQNHYPVDRVRARKTHAEDWAAFLIFNHLFAGIDALVAAQLWELPAQVEMRAAPGIVSVRAGFRW